MITIKSNIMKDLLKGKALEHFEKWYLNWIFKEKTYLSLRFSDEQILENWKSLHSSEQYGVLVDFFDSVGVVVTIGNWIEYKVGFFYWFNINDKSDKCLISDYDCINLKHARYKTLQEARKQAIKKAVEILNSEV